MIFSLQNSVNQQINLIKKNGLNLFLKREDAIHSFVSGNKYRKLKYNLIKAEKQGLKTLLTFGGAYSNHIAAVAFAGKHFGFNTIGYIRGEELHSNIASNPTLKFAQNCGMELQFISREDYRKKTTKDFANQLKAYHGNFYLIPEGGTNVLAVKGCEEILNKEDDHFDYVCCAVGTGGTIAGLINGSKPSQKVLGFPALKGNFLQQDISKFAESNHWDLIADYHFGGYAKINSELISFINQFKESQNILLDPIYTGKMMFGVFDLIKKGYFPKGSNILAIHTGGLQGIAGVNLKLKKKNLPIIKM